MKTLKVKINIAGRQYPLTIDADEEIAVREAGKEINQMIESFEKKYAVTDKQDAIAMAALQIAAKYSSLKRSGLGFNKETNEKLEDLTQLIERELDN